MILWLGCIILLFVCCFVGILVSFMIVTTNQMVLILMVLISHHWHVQLERNVLDYLSVRCGLPLWICSQRPHIMSRSSYLNGLNRYLNFSNACLTPEGARSSCTIPTNHSLDQKGLPLGLQVIGKPFDEETVFNVAKNIETAAQFSAKPQMIGLQKAA